MKTKHTKGNWIVKEWEKEGTDFFHIRSEQKFTDLIATIYRWKGHIDKREAIANAKLIAAAPELLDACDAVLTAWHSKLSNIDKREPAYLQQIRDVIRKATE